MAPLSKQSTLNSNARGGKPSTACGSIVPTQSHADEVPSPRIVRCFAVLGNFKVYRGQAGSRKNKLPTRCGEAARKGSIDRFYIVPLRAPLCPQQCNSAAGDCRGRRGPLSTSAGSHRGPGGSTPPQERRHSRTSNYAIGSNRPAPSPQKLHYNSLKEYKKPVATQREREF